MITFSLVVIVTAWQGDLSRAFSEGGVNECQFHRFVT